MAGEKRKSETTKEPKPTKKAVKSKAEKSFTLCIPSTIIDYSNAKSIEQITNIAYHIARAAAVYNVGEIVILDVPDEESLTEAVQIDATGKKKIKFNFDDDEITPASNATPNATSKTAIKKFSDEALYFATLLQYFVTPPYLTKSIFKNSKFVKKFTYASKLPKITTLPFMQNNNVSKDFKEGLTISKQQPPKPAQNKKGKKPKQKSITTKYVNIGEAEPLELDGQEVPVNVRVTVDLRNKKVVSPVEAYGVIGAKSSFGYHVRLTKTFSSIFTESSYPEGYDQAIYVNSGEFFITAKEKEKRTLSTVTSESINKGNCLLLVGGWKDINFCFENDKRSLEGVSSAAEMFDGEMEIPQGVRIEDGVMIALTKLHS